MSRFSKFYYDWLKYRSSIAWVLHDLLRLFKWRWLAASFVSFCSPALQAFAFALLTSFIVSAANGTPIEARFIKLSFLDPTELSTVFFVAIVCPGLLLVSGLARYLGDQLFISLRFDYTRFNLERGIQKIFLYWGGYDNELVKMRSNLVILIRSDAVSCGRLAMLAASAITPLVEFLIFGLLAVYVYPLLTGLIAFAAMLTFSHFRRIMSNGSYYFSAREKQAFESGNELREYIKQSNYVQVSSLGKRSTFINQFPSTESWIYSLFEYTLVGPRSLLVSAAFSSLSFAIIITFLGNRIVAQSSALSESLIYLILLRYVMRSFQQFTSRFSSLNIFYEQVVRYKRILDGKLPPDFSADYKVDDEFDV